MLSKRLKAVIFDLDGVILDSMSGHAAAWLETFTEAGFQVDKDYIYQNEGMIDLERLSILSANNKRGYDQNYFDRLLARQRDIYLEKYLSSTRIFSGADELVKRLSRAGLSLALVTSSTKEVLAPQLVDWLDTYFTKVVTGDQVERSKPYPDPYLKALEALRVDRSEVVVVENAPAGIEAAKSAGLICLALTTTLPPKSLDRADIILNGHDELSAWLEPFVIGKADPGAA